LPTTLAAATRTCRILYYGPAGSGKRENLARIQSSLPSEHRLAVAADDPNRQIAFMLRNGDEGDWQIFVQALDCGREPAVSSAAKVPFDGIVFVCDSRPSMLDEALSAMEGLKSYLDCWRLDIMSVPMVLQYNHRDAEGVLPVDRLESLLNPWGLLSFPAVATSGEGIREPLKAILSLTIGSILQRYVGKPSAENDAQLDIDPNPPVPGTTHTPDRGPERTREKLEKAVKPGGADQAAVHARPGAEGAIVVPVRVPRGAIAPDGAVRLVLDIKVVDD
jgi:hypothetical protein